MVWKLFIDDERMPAWENVFKIARTSKAACGFVITFGIPSFISFDHDLGGDDTSMRFIHWLADYMLDNSLAFPKGFGYYVHSQNSVGRDNIKSLMDSMISHFGYEG